MREYETTRRGFLKLAGVAALAGAAGAAGEARAQVPTTQPERLLEVPEALFRPTGAGCTLHWVPRGTVEARVLAGPEPQRLSVVHEVSSADTVTVPLDGFGADANTYLQCQFRRPGKSEWLVRPVRRVQTRRAAGQTFRVDLIADSHVYRADRVAQRVRNLAHTSEMVIADRPDFVVFLGDEPGVYSWHDAPGYMTQARAIERWTHWRGVYGTLLAAVPSFMCLGNHEGEGGFHQSRRLESHLMCYQRWGTVARKQRFLNPLPDTYPEGGENEGWVGDPDAPATGGAVEGNRSPLENYYAWTWGDALFVVLDVHRYTNVGGSTPKSVDEWTLGDTQLRWLEHVLESSSARWKIVIAHHLVGGSAWDLTGKSRRTDYVYGRGGARYAWVGEQQRISSLMKRTGAGLFLYGHDHVFAHQQTEGLHFVCCGRPTFLQPSWWDGPGWKEAYGDASARNPHDFYAAIGYTRLTVSPRQVRVEYVRSGTDERRAENVTQAERDVVYSFSIDA